MRNGLESSGDMTSLSDLMEGVYIKEGVASGLGLGVWRNGKRQLFFFSTQVGHVRTNFAISSFGIQEY